MSDQVWTTTSRFRALREWEWDSSRSLLTVKCHDTLYYSMSGASSGPLLSIDPDGGPYLQIGQVVETNSDLLLQLKHIVSHSRDVFSKVLVIQIECEVIS